MRPLSEKSIQMAVVNYAKSRGVTCIKLGMVGAFGSQGWPDFLLLSFGAALFIEFKAPGKEPTALQKVRHQELRSQGFEVVVVDDAVVGKMFVDNL